MRRQTQANAGEHPRLMLEEQHVGRGHGVLLSAGALGVGHVADELLVRHGEELVLCARTEDGAPGESRGPCREGGRLGAEP